jgi:exopolysaccharide biosynthesis polyprenyl glycosylphosphotransferase
MFRRQILLKAFQLYDLLAMVLSFTLAASVVSYRVPHVTFSEFLAMRIKVQNFVLFLALLALWHLIFSALKLYHSRRLSSRWKEIFDVLKATTLGTLVISLAAIMLRFEMATPVFLVVFWVAASGASIAGRLLMRLTLARLRERGRNLRFVLIIGTNPRAVGFARKIEQRPELGYRIIGFADDLWAGIKQFQKAGYRLVTDLRNLSSFIRENVVDEVIIGLPVKSFYDAAARIVSQCEEQGIIVRYTSDIFNTSAGRTEAEHFADAHLISHYTGAMEGWSVAAKRVLDISASLTLLIILFPLFLVVALLIKATSPGPVFFVQGRVGQSKKRFRFYKFRTMVQDAERMQQDLESFNEAKGPVFKMKDDPRVTPIGRILRKLSIDELPQLYNVLKGEMSLVGPRPLPIRDYNAFNEDWHRRRFSVRPGMTCLWQVNGRSSLPFEKWMELDMAYIDNWSIGLDLIILLKTVPAVLRGSGAS